MKNQGITIAFKPDGSAQCVWRDEIPRLRLGKLSVKRASNVEFNEATEEWEVRLVGSTEVIHSEPTRAGAIAWEIEFIENALCA